MLKNKTIISKSLIYLIVLIPIIMFMYIKSSQDNMFHFLNTKSFNDLYDREVVLIEFLNNEEEKTIKQNSVKLSVEVVNSPETTRQGLSGRNKIGSDGMLFIFPDNIVRNFWMLDMKIDLDFVWINENKIVGFSKNIKKPKIGTKNQDLELISINKVTNKVLELNVGDIDRYNLKVGDVVILK